MFIHKVRPSNVEIFVIGDIQKASINVYLLFESHTLTNDGYFWSSIDKYM